MSDKNLPRIVLAPEQWLTKDWLEESPYSRDHVWIFYQDKYFMFKLKIDHPEESNIHLDWGEEGHEEIVGYVSESPGNLLAIFPAQ